MTSRNLDEMNHVLDGVLRRLLEVEGRTYPKLSAFSSLKERVEALEQMPSHAREYLMSVPRNLPLKAIDVFFLFDHLDSLRRAAEAERAAEAAKPGKLEPAPTEINRIPLVYPRDAKTNAVSWPGVIGAVFDEGERVVGENTAQAEINRRRSAELHLLVAKQTLDRHLRELEEIQQTIERAFGEGFGVTQFRRIREALHDAHRPNGVGKMERG